jgi:hypothetical protein
MLVLNPERSPVTFAYIALVILVLCAGRLAAAAPPRELPDIDIDDEYANMAGNVLSAEVGVGAVDVVLGEFLVYAAGPSTNVDEWDGPGTESILDLQYYNPTSGELTKIPADGVSPPASFWVYGPTDSLEILLDGVMGDTLILDGPAKKYRVRIAEVPLSASCGTYTSLHPAQWPPGNGTVPICCRGVASGLGWLPGEVGPGVVYDPEDAGLQELMDYFFLEVEVVPFLDAEFQDGSSWSESGDPGSVLCDSVVVCNTGNCELHDIHLEASNLIGTGFAQVIPSTAIDFDPVSVGALPEGECASVEVCVAVPVGQRSDTYLGTLTLLAEGGMEFDQLEIEVVVACVPELNVTDNAYDVIANVMTLWLTPGEPVSGAFEVCNMGNCDLVLGGSVEPGPPMGIFLLDVTLPPTCGWEECEIGQVSAEWSDPGVPAGIYQGEVSVTGEPARVSDSFVLRVVVPELMAARFEEDAINLNGSPAALIDTSLTVLNTGNSDLPAGTLLLVPGDLVGDDGDVIDAQAIEIESDIGIPFDGQAEFPVTIQLPSPLPDSLYTGTIELFLAGEFEDELTLRIRNGGTPVEDAFFGELTSSGTVMLRWVSGALQCAQALDILRATSADGPYVRINEDPIPVSSPGAYEDDTVWSETTFWYELRAVLANGMEQVISGAPAVVRTDGHLAFRLFPGYPNPAAGSVTLQFDVPVATCSLTLRIYTPGGKLVTTLVAENPGRGRHVITWPGTDQGGRRVSSGVYCARLATDRAVSEQKVVLTR